MRGRIERLKNSLNLTLSREDCQGKLQLTKCYRMLTNDENNARFGAISIPCCFHIGQGHKFRFNFQLGGDDGLDHAMNRADQALESNASDSASHQYQRR